MFLLRRDSAFTDPRQVLRLLSWLRLAAFLVVMSLLAIAQWAGIDALQDAIHWRWIFVGLLLSILLSGVSMMLRNTLIDNRLLYAVILLDILAWFLLLNASGGSVNPAVSYLLVLLSIAALSLSISQSVTLLIVIMAFYTLMMQHQPAEGHQHMFGWHLWGMWLLFLLNALVMLVVIELLIHKLAQKDQAIARYKENTVRSEQLVMMGTMAANITHELGTPLSTIAMLTAEHDNEDADLIREQVERCKQALGQLKALGDDQQASQSLDSSVFFERLRQELLLIQPGVALTIDDQLQQPFRVSLLLNQALLALLNNASDACSSIVTLSAFEQGGRCVLTITHDGDGISEALIEQLGLTRVASAKNGLGIGYYLANASIERLGGTLTIRNLDVGVETRVLFNREALIDG
ncbi:Sensor histidine kinase RegB [BD1-7 clade bacterium]|uniref:histidine kinase n=1 Tax=BD1-7 clade bacterium TaxID=2029982 RepID=A0A5S9QEA0_9GAMM|nr:Sensor histidine kinase RegB [BD1-7 clade bacterium]